MEVIEVIHFERGVNEWKWECYCHRNKIDKVVKALWNLDSYDDVDIILSIVVNLGLSQSFIKIKESLHTEQINDPRIRKEIEETVVEVGEHISNPYHDLERFK